jgi:hypothetical protein
MRILILDPLTVALQYLVARWPRMDFGVLLLYPVYLLCSSFMYSILMLATIWCTSSFDISSWVRYAVIFCLVSASSCRILYLVSLSFFNN